MVKPYFDVWRLNYYRSHTAVRFWYSIKKPIDIAKKNPKWLTDGKTVLVWNHDGLMRNSRIIDSTMINSAYTRGHKLKNTGVLRLTLTEVDGIREPEDFFYLWGYYTRSHPPYQQTATVSALLLDGYTDYAQLAVDGSEDAAST